MRPVLFSAIFLSGLLSGCKITDKESLPYARLYVANVSPDAPALNMYNRDNLLIGNLSYSKDTGYFTTNVGAYEFKLATVGSQDFISDEIVTLGAGKYYSLFLIDSFSKITTTYCEDVFSTPPADSCMVRYLDLSPVLTTTHNAIFLNNTDTSRFTLRSFNDQEANSAQQRFRKIKAGTYRLDILNYADSTLITTINNFSFAGNKVYTVYVKNFGNANYPDSLSAGVLLHNP